MKTTIKLLLGAYLSLSFIACQEEVAPTPQAAMTINKSQLAINESMVIHFTGFAEQVVIYPGDNMHDYELREQSNTGLVVNKGLFTYSYTSPGIYKVVCVASTYTERAADLKRDTCSVTVTVTDDVTEIDKLSCPQIVRDEVFARRLPDDEWLMLLPQKVKYNTSSPTIALKQRLKLYIASDSTKVTIGGEAYATNKKYDLSQPLDILVQSHAGTQRTYKLYTLQYPEFASFKLNGVEGTLVRDIFDYSGLEMDVVLPEGTDMTRLVPEFTTTSGHDKVYIGEAEQISGSSTVDFTQAVTYRLVHTMDGHPDKQAVSTVKVNIMYE